MTDVQAEFANACRRAEQETIAAIQAASDGAARAHRELSILHVARAQRLLRAMDMPFTPHVPSPDLRLMVFA